MCVRVCVCVCVFVSNVVVIFLVPVWPHPAYSVSSTYVDLNLPASSNPSSTRYSIFIQREGEDIFSFLGSYYGKCDIL